jgi:hypothetical protein
MAVREEHKQAAAQMLAADGELMAAMKQKWGEPRAVVMSELANILNVSMHVMPALRPMFENLVDGVTTAFDLPMGDMSAPFGERVEPGSRRDFVHDLAALARGRLMQVPAANDLKLIDGDECRAIVSDKSKLN